MVTVFLGVPDWLPCPSIWYTRSMPSITAQDIEFRVQRSRVYTLNPWQNQSRERAREAAHRSAAAHAAALIPAVRLVRQLFK